MTENENFEQEQEETKNTMSLSDLLGMSFDDKGNWSAKDTGNSPIMRKLNRQERRKQAKMDRKKGK